MSKKKGKDLWQLCLFTAIVAVVIFLLKYIIRVTYIHDTIWYILLFVLFQTFFSVWVSHIGVQKSHQAFVKYALVATVVRLTLSIVFVFVALQLGVAHRLSFVVNFLIMYFAFLVFEIISLLTTLRANFENHI